MPDLFDQLTATTKDLIFTSESDAPVKAFRAPLPKQAAKQVDSLTPDIILAATNHPAGTPVTTQTVDAFFAPATIDQDWYGDEEKATSARFHELVGLLKDNLPDVQVFKVGAGSERDVYIVGLSRADANKKGSSGIATDKQKRSKRETAKTMAGIVGVQTQVVET